MTPTSEEYRALLEERRTNHLARIGAVMEQVVSRMLPVCGSLWPASPLGRMRIVRRPRSRLLVTDGLSVPYDPELHADPPDAPLDYELALDVLELDPAGRDDTALAESTYPTILHALADMAVREHFDLRARLSKFRAITISIPTVSSPREDPLVSDEGTIGVLVGLPLVGRDLDLHPYMHDYYTGIDAPWSKASLGVFPVKPLLPDELAWARLRGNEGAAELALRFLERRDGHFAWRGRPSVLARSTLS